MVMDELTGTLEGCINWMSALLVLIEETDCNPDDPDKFDEIQLAATLMMGQAENILKKYKK
jgi:hypothetical protein